MSTYGNATTVVNYSVGEKTLGLIMRSVDCRWKPCYGFSLFLQSRD